jgi:hypothetical protein
VLLPTGFGKSLIFQLAPFVHSEKNGILSKDFRSVCIVITPLNSIILYIYIYIYIYLFSIKLTDQKLCHMINSKVVPAFFLHTFCFRLKMRGRGIDSSVPSSGRLALDNS